MRHRIRLNFTRCKLKIDIKNIYLSLFFVVVRFETQLYAAKRYKRLPYLRVFYLKGSASSGINATTCFVYVLVKLSIYYFKLIPTTRSIVQRYSNFEKIFSR